MDTFNSVEVKIEYSPIRNDEENSEFEVKQEKLEDLHESIQISDVKKEPEEVNNECEDGQYYTMNESQQLVSTMDVTFKKEIKTENTPMEYENIYGAISRSKDKPNYHSDIEMKYYTSCDDDDDTKVICDKQLLVNLTKIRPCGICSSDSLSACSSGSNTNLEELRFKCPLCICGFRTTKARWGHIGMHTGNDLYKCGLCQKSFAILRMLTKHMRFEHPVKKLSQCDTSNSTTQHVEPENPVEELNQCDISNSTTIRMKNDMYKCGLCDKSFTVLRMLTEHIRLEHSVEKPKQHDSANELEKHNIITHCNEKQFKCPHCDFATKFTNSLRTHIRTHTGERPYKCTHCTYAASQINTLKIHLRIHTGEKPHKCPHCEYATNLNASLKLHLRTHTGEKPYKCPHCTYTAHRLNTLKNHITTHTGEKPHKCQYCEYATNQVGSLRTHLMTHSTEKPHKCPHCEYATILNASLKLHLRTHTGEKPYKCPHCTYAANRINTLKDHLRTHTGEKPHKCTHCEYATKQMSSLRRHLRTHTVQTTQKLGE